ncbi:hypothetical protein WA026_000083 [Henosepilachna vigintioctopunctata]|uniref:DUF4485 domain-containing protein n=1 Tax=Henosepilachna vigintioctopunctata TaxID=420089 RepID=A0AAW1UY51_9CUCU
MNIDTRIYGDSSQDDLDVDYNQILLIIKSLIRNVTNNDHMAQFRIWLEKLDNTSNEEKGIRNQYLMELARQIRCKHLESPFTEAPPVGALLPIKVKPWTHEECPENTFEDDMEDPNVFMNRQMMCQQWNEDNRLQFPYHKVMARPRRSATSQQVQAAQRCVQRSAINVKRMHLLREIKNQCGNDYSEGSDSGTTPSRSPTRPHRHAFSPRPALSKTPTSPPGPADARNDFDVKMRLHQASLGVIPEDKSDVREVASWENLTDVSDESFAVMGSGDTDKMRERGRSVARGENLKTKINSLVYEMNGLKRKSEIVNERCEHTIRSVQERIPLKSPNSSPEDTKVRQIDSIDYKQVADQNGDSFLASDWKQIIESLQLRLSETQHQNNELNALTSTLRKKVKELDANKEQVKQEIRKQIYEQHKKEVESLKSEHQKCVKEMQSAQETKVEEMEKAAEKRVLAEAAKYESKISDLKEKYDKELRGKDIEIRRLEDVIQKECMRLLNEITVLRTQIEEASSTNTTNNEQIIFLQKCIAKMDRLFQKSERDYCKEIEKLKQDLDNRKKATQIQLQTQKAEVITRCSAEKQSELDTIVESLKDKYSTLLEMQQVQMSRIRNEDEKIICELKSILDQHNIPYPY